MAVIKSGKLSEESESVTEKQSIRVILDKYTAAINGSRSTTNAHHGRHIIVMLAVIGALQMTSFGVIMPIFARRFADFGDGLEALGLTAMAYSLTSIVAAPFMGSLADRFGRRPLLLGSLASYVAAFTGYLLATTTGTFFIIRTLAGALTAGFGPAAMGIVADTAPENERAQWIGVVAGGSSIGWIVGPALGGMLYDAWGYAAPFMVSVVIAIVALIAAFIVVPETHTCEARQRTRSKRSIQAAAKSPPVSLWDALPRPLPTFTALLFVSFIMVFAWAFAEPQLTFYIYDDLGWTSARFGLAISGYGVAAFLGQMILGRTSDSFGRLPIIMVGLLLHSVQYVGMMLTGSFHLIVFAYILAGLGEALISPSLGAFFLDITPEQHKSRVMGIKGSISSLGSVAGPLLAVVAGRSLAPQGVFLLSGALLAFSALLLLIVPGKRDQTAGEIADKASVSRLK